MGLSEFDVHMVDKIVAGEEGTWFTAKLLRLIMSADIINREKLRKVYPEEVSLIENRYGEQNDVDGK